MIALYGGGSGLASFLGHAALWALVSRLIHGVGLVAALAIVAGLVLLWISTRAGGGRA